jgi:exopolyphosphatase/guanosine-5'-triphosphate,3'-diphosphate pyrophosphatase
MRASIDIGTNTLLMLVEEAANTYANYHRIARLGENLHSSGVISENALTRATVILEEYRQILLQYDSYSLRCVGTAALRKAKNSEQICKEFSSILSVPIEVISGEEEAYYTFMGTVENEEPSVVIDIGGGSTEIVIGSSKSGIVWRNSFQIGAVTLTEQFRNSDTVLNSIREKVVSELQSIPSDIISLIQSAPYVYANAGTPTTLAAVAMELDVFDESKVNGYKLEYQLLKDLEQKFHQIPLNELKSVIGVHPDRADILPAGTSILSSLFEFFSFNACLVSTKGLRYGVLQSIKI